MIKDILIDKYPVIEELLAYGGPITDSMTLLLNNITFYFEFTKDRNGSIELFKDYFRVVLLHSYLFPSKLGKLTEEEHNYLIDICRIVL